MAGWRAVWPLLALIACAAGCGDEGAEEPVGPNGGETPEANGAGIAAFADSALEAAVRVALEKPAGKLGEADLLSLTMLEARRRGIVDLSGIEQLMNLTVLDLADNRILDASRLASLTQLTFLDLDNNRIE